MIWLALALGIAGSAHCAAMCGGIASVLCAGAPRVRFIAAYNLGRVASYAVFGALAGFFGDFARAPFGDLRLGLRILAAIVVTLVGLRLLGLTRATNFIEGIGSPLFKLMRPLASKLLPVRTTTHALLLGAIWGWLPCGMVYAAATLALASGRWSSGALVMAMFGLGTLPAMLVLSTFASRVTRLMDRPRFGTQLRRIAGSALIVSSVLSVVGSMTIAPSTETPIVACGH
jgi:sulfite exporter TauE/SafE